MKGDYTSIPVHRNVPARIESRQFSTIATSAQFKRSGLCEIIHVTRCDGLGSLRWIRNVGSGVDLSYPARSITKRPGVGRRTPGHAQRKTFHAEKVNHNELKYCKGNKISDIEQVQNEQYLRQLDRVDCMVHPP